MTDFSNLQVPFRWEPDGLMAGQWIESIRLWIQSYPTFYSVYRDGRHKPGMQVYWLEHDFVVCPNIWLNYYQSLVYPPLGVRPTGVMVTSPEHVKLSGQASITTRQTSSAVEDIVARIEPMIIRIAAKIDALP